MGRKSRSSPLVLWANGRRVGFWTPPGRKPTELRYDESWVKSPFGRPLSLSLPMPLVGNEPLRGDVVENWFDNLLPENQNIRRRLAQRYAAGSEDSFDLLAAIGRDCVGAIQLLPVDEKPDGVDRIEGTVLSEDEVAQPLRRRRPASTRTTLTCASRLPAPRRRRRCFGATGSGCGRMGRRPPRTS